MDTVPGENVYGPPSIFTGHIFQDIKRFFYADDATSIEEIQPSFSLLDEHSQHKLVVLSERIEFVFHLMELKGLLVAN